MKEIIGEEGQTFFIKQKSKTIQVYYQKIMNRAYGSTQIPMRGLNPKLT